MHIFGSRGVKNVKIPPEIKSKYFLLVYNYGMEWSNGTKSTRKLPQPQIHPNQNGRRESATNSVANRGQGGSRVPPRVKILSGKKRRKREIVQNRGKTKRHKTPRHFQNTSLLRLKLATLW